MSAQDPWAPRGQAPAPPPLPPPPPAGGWGGPPPYGYPPVAGQLRPPTSVPAIFGRIIAFLGIAAALTCSVIWFFVGGMSLAAGPLCVDCAVGWLPPVAVGVLGPLVPLALWTVTLIMQWRSPLLLLWSLLGWPVLGAVNIWAIERFATLFAQ